MMSNNSFINSSYYNSFYNEIAQEYRRVNHSLDNYGVDMSKDLKEVLQRLSNTTKEVLEIMQRDKNN